MKKITNVFNKVKAIYDTEIDKQKQKLEPILNKHGNRIIKKLINKSFISEVDFTKNPKLIVESDYEDVVENGMPIVRAKRYDEIAEVERQNAAQDNILRENIKPYDQTIQELVDSIIPDFKELICQDRVNEFLKMKITDKNVFYEIYYRIKKEVPEVHQCVADFTEKEAQEK